MAAITIQGANLSYGALRGRQVAREQARIVLPMATYTQFVVTQNLHNLLHFLHLRLAADAQQEIRVYAQAMLGVIREYVPATIASWENHVLHAARFSRDEITALRLLVRDLRDHTGWTSDDLLEQVVGEHFTPETGGEKSRRAEFYQKAWRLTSAL